MGRRECWCLWRMLRGDLAVQARIRANLFDGDGKGGDVVEEALDHLLAKEDNVGHANGRGLAVGRLLGQRLQRLDGDADLGDRHTLLEKEVPHEATTTSWK